MDIDPSFNLDSFYTDKHKRLDTIAKAAQVMAWVVLVFVVIFAILRFIGEVNITINFFQGYPVTQSFQELLKLNPWYALSLLSEMFYNALKSLIWFLVLKGLSMGLYIIIEIDLNSKEKAG